MKSNELRIGNWVTFVCDEGFLNVQMPLIPETLDCKKYKPIPIDGEWLEIFGFIKDNDDYFSINSKEYGYELLVLICGDCFELSVYNGDGNPLTISSVKHIHQLQNFVFSLTGKDLERK